MPIPIRAPARISILLRQDEEAAGKQITDIMIKALAQSVKRINTMAGKLSEARIEKMEMLAEEAGEVFTQYMEKKILSVAFAYLACRTDLVTIRNQAKEEASFAALEDQFSKLETLMGKKMAAEVLRVLTYNIDVTLEETFGRQL